MKDFKKSVVYQIYPRSFKDSSGDGIGDLKGVTEKLNYLKNLGVDYIWLTPFYISPQVDNGYDVADYLSIDSRFGTMEDFEEMVREAKKLDIEVMLDMVFNHTSTQHKWFKNAMKGEEKYKDYYIFKEPVEGNEPTNWISKFGGSAWEYTSKFKEYYLHLFDVKQADLNWENEELKKELFQVVNFWMEKGVKGFRFDVINLISKPVKYENDYLGDGRRFYTDGAKTHEYLKELNSETFGRDEDIITVGEMSSTTIDNCSRYSNPEENELSMVFNFHHLKVDYKDGDKWSLMDFDFIKLKEILNAWQIGLQDSGGWNALFWCNHDQPRIVSRFGDDSKYHKESAKMLATTMHMLRGTPYIYQGEEIGMTNPHFDKIELYKDIESINYYNILKAEGKPKGEIIRILGSKSRDNARTPVQWNDTKNAGFTTGSPYISVSDNYSEINVEKALEDTDSVFYHYKKLIELRKEFDVIAYGDFKPILEDDSKIFAYVRYYNEEKLLVINNFYGKDAIFNLPEGLKLQGESKILLSNYSDTVNDTQKLKLRPYEAVVFYIK